MFLAALGLALFAKPVAETMAVSNYRRNERKEQEIIKKWGGKGYPTAHIWPYDTHYLECMEELNAFWKQTGQLTVTIYKTFEDAEYAYYRNLCKDIGRQPDGFKKWLETYTGMRGKMGYGRDYWPSRDAAKKRQMEGIR